MVLPAPLTTPVAARESFDPVYSPPSAAPSSRTLYCVVKRTLDLIVASSMLLFLLPVLAGAVIAVIITSPGPIFFVQERCGQGRTVIGCRKLRTMVVNAEGCLSADGDLARQWGANCKLQDDPRVTPVGRILRATSLDELPQLLNVISGDMSMVGPRPVPHHELELMYGPHAAEVRSVKPGLTGLWQVSGRSATTYEKRVQLDLEYVRTQSLRGDLAIMAKTPRAVLTRRGAV